MTFWLRRKSATKACDRLVCEPLCLCCFALHSGSMCFRVLCVRVCVCVCVVPEAAVFVRACALVVCRFLYYAHACVSCACFVFCLFCLAVLFVLCASSVSCLRVLLRSQQRPSQPPSKNFLSS